MTDFLDLTDAEKEFRELLAKPREYSKWAKEVRAAWLAARPTKAEESQ